MESELQYLARRAEFHREMSRTSPCPEARCTHEAFVWAYTQRIEALSGSAAPPRELDPPGTQSPDAAAAAAIPSPAVTAG